MIIHSIIPMEIIMKNEESNSNYNIYNIVLSIDGNLIEVQPAGQDRYRVVRILSTNPSAYLNSEYQPGETFYYPG